MTKLLILGLDGADFEIINPLFEQGRMPNLERIANEGTTGPLTSTIPPSTCPGWQAFYTGRSPGNLGIYGFKNFSRDSYSPEIPDSSDLNEPTFWELLGDEGIKTGIVGGPFTYPPQPIEGFMISGPWTPSTSETFTYPDDLTTEIRELVDDYTFIPDEYEVETFKPMFRQRTDVATHVLKQREWDVCTLVYRPDPLQHVYWGKDDEKVFRIYEYMDKCIGEVLDTVASQDEDVNILVMSDHGFEGIRSRYFNANQWLVEEGWLTLSSGTGSLLSLIPLEAMLNVASKVGALGVIKRTVPFEYQKKVRNPLGAVDWSRTEAFFQFEELTGQIYINREDRFPEGIVDSEEVPALKNEIISGLESVTDHRDRQVVTETWQDTDLYPGEYTDLAPDISFKLHPEFKGEGKFGELFTEIDDRRAEGGHSLDGILMATGPQFGTGHIEDANIVDLAPTILHLMDTPVETGMDGEVLWDLYPEDSDLRDRDVETIERSSGERQKADWADEQREEVEGHLEDLGYL